MKKANVTFKLHIYCCKDCMNELKEFDNCICIDYDLFIKSEISLSFVTWGKREYKKITFHKLDAILYTLKNNNVDYVGYIDTDIVLFSDPTPIILNKFNENPIKVVSQCDERDFCSNIFSCKGICSGVIAFHNDTNLYHIFDYNESDIDKYNGDQSYLVTKLKQNNIPTLTVEKNIFIHGYCIKKGCSTNEACLLHFNYMIGKEKIEYMKKLNYWYI